MTGMELVAKLWESGTGAEVLAPARDLLRHNPKAAAEDVLLAFRDAGTNPVTTDKAQKILAGKFKMPKAPRCSVDCPPEDWPALAQLAESTNEAASARQQARLEAEEEKVRREQERSPAA